MNHKNEMKSYNSTTLISTIDDVIEAVVEVCKHKNLKVTVEQSLRGGLIAGVSTILGGILMGPRGLTVGALVGGVAAVATSNEFKSAFNVIKEMTPGEKRRLYECLVKAIKNIAPYALAYAIRCNPDVTKTALEVVSEFLHKEKSMKIAV